jgi:hypothetical protein
MQKRNGWLLRSARVVGVLTAAALVAAVSPVAAPPSLAQTAPSGPVAPAGFANDLTRIYDEATSVPPPPGVTWSAPGSADDVHQKIASLTQDQLNAIYATNPTGWPGVLSAVDAYAQGVAPSAGQTAAQPATGPPKPPSPAPAADGGTPPPPVVFTPTPCPGLAFPAQGGAYQELYSLNVAKGAVALVGEELETAAEAKAGDALIATFGEAFTVPLAEIATVTAFLLSEEGLSIAATVIDAVADAMELPIDVVEFLLHRAIDSCQYDNSVGEVPFVDTNEVATQNNVNASYGLGQKNFKLDQAINQLLDDRTQKIVGQLNTAQVSLDQNLKHSIELALSGGNATTIVSYELPASLGGYLDSTPIGVQAIVTSTMSLMQSANQPISPQAGKNLTLANQALAAGQYKQAFVYYQTAYGLLVR